MQYGKWKLMVTWVTCIVIYRPPYSLTNQETVAKFLDKFIEWLANISCSHDMT